jgi:hypothetical protein
MRDKEEDIKELAAILHTLLDYVVCMKLATKYKNGKDPNLDNYTKRLLEIEKGVSKN